MNENVSQVGNGFTCGEATYRIYLARLLSPCGERPHRRAAEQVMNFRRLMPTMGFPSADGRM